MSAVQKAPLRRPRRLAGEYRFGMGVQPTSDSGRSALDMAPEGALDEVWRALCHHYPLMEYLGADQTWVDALRPRVRAAQDLVEALPIIEELVLRFQDCHTRLWWPGKPQLSLPDVRLGWVEDGLAVLRAGADTGLHPGDRILAVDGVPAAAAIEAVWARSQGSSREAHLRSACERLVAGRPGTVSHLRTERGEVRLVRPALGQGGAAGSSPLGVRPLPGGDAALLRISGWAGIPGFSDVLDRLLEQVADHPCLVIDVRGNPGGHDENARACIGRFAAHRFLCSICFYRGPGTRTYEPTFAYCDPRGPWRYAGRVAVLIDERCFSACTHFAAGMRASGVACLIGAPTNGGGAFMQEVPLNCGATLVCARGFPIDGGVGGYPSPMHGTEPHIRVPPNLEDLRSGRDTALEAALDWLRSGRPVPQA